MPSVEKPVSIIVAMTKDYLIGNKNNLPWHLPEDLKLFKQITMGNILIMGRKTFESIGKPLPGRKNFIISASAFKEESVGSNQPDANEYETGKAYYFKSLEDAINASFSTEGTPFIIGGASVYKQALPLVKKLYISFVKNSHDGDAYFPELDFNEWELLEEKDFKDFVWKSFTRR
ncbi:MAG: dihydrofolate reductase [Spirochaetaceae bacterium]|nr:dihydrofolate reductase [Spirochaetaceae bacterium]